MKFKVGDIVNIIGTPVIGKIEEIDNWTKDYYVKPSGGLAAWYEESELQFQDPISVSAYTSTATQPGIAGSGNYKVAIPYGLGSAPSIKVPPPPSYTRQGKSVPIVYGAGGSGGNGKINQGILSPPPYPTSQASPSFSIGETVEVISSGFTGVIEMHNPQTDLFRVKGLSGNYDWYHRNEIQRPVVMSGPKAFTGNIIQVPLNGWGAPIMSTTKSDSVQVGDVATFNGRACIVTAIDFSSASEIRYLLDDAVWVKGSELKFKSLPGAGWEGPKCECGAHKTINANLHSNWCARFGRD